MKAYIITTRIDFDNLENRDPESRRTLGVALSLKRAETVITEKMAARTPYKGWDGNLYPKFEIMDAEVFE